MLPNRNNRLLRYAKQLYRGYAALGKPSLPQQSGSLDLRDPVENPFFSYTSGRWLWDEANQYHKRHQKFNVNEPQHVAIKSVNASLCTSMIKLPEGAYNKAFLLTMNNASEVATLDFLRNELDIPVPRVLAWSGDKDQSVGVEYIIVEKVPGEELWKSWPTMGISERVDLVSQLVTIQSKISSVDFKYYGSLYYRDEIDGYHDIPGVPSRFCIGPSSALQFWEAERQLMDGYRGPWTSPVSYAMDLANREKDWIRQFAKPRDLSDPLRQSTSQESPSSHIDLLDKYQKLVPGVVPPDQKLSRSTLWHPDLHFGNIFVTNKKIVGIIDWQGCMSLPLFLAAKLPKLLRFQGQALFDLPPAAGLTSTEKKETLLRYQLTQLQGFYVSKFQFLDHTVFQALTYPYATLRQQLIDFSGSTWEDDGLFLLREMMHQVWRDWDDITDQGNGPCPITFSSNDFESHAVEQASWDKYKELFDSLGISMDGWVHSEDFQAKAELLRNLATQILESSDNRKEARRALEAWKLSDPASTQSNHGVMKF